MRGDTRPEDAVAAARESVALAGHPDVSWSVVIEAGLAAAPATADVQARLDAVLPGHPHLGPSPRVRSVDDAALAGERQRIADEPYAAGGPATRVTIVAGASSRLLVAAHEGALDGLGLLGLAGLALGLPLASSARGVGADPPRGSFAASALRAVTEAAVRPPTRVAAAGGRPGARGDELGARDAGSLRGTAHIVAAAARAVVAWNAGHGAQAGRIVTVIGASHRAGDAITLDHAAAWMRVRPGRGDDAIVAARIAAEQPRPVGPPARLPGPAIGAIRLLSKRLGSTFLVSNLGLIAAPPAVTSLAFFPVAHGRSGVAFGAATVGNASTITIRARARRFDAAAAAEILDRVAGELGAATGRGARTAGSRR